MEYGEKHPAVGQRSRGQENRIDTHVNIAVILGVCVMDQAKT